MLWKENWKSSKSTYDLSDMDEAYADLPEWQEWRRYWFIMPKHEEWYETYYDAIVNYFTNSKAPWGSNFYKWVSNFLLYWHINGESEWSYYDKQLEEFFTRIQEKDPGALKDLVSNDKLMAEVASDTKKSIQTSLSFMEKELALVMLRIEMSCSFLIAVRKLDMIQLRVEVADRRMMELYTNSLAREVMGRVEK